MPLLLCALFLWLLLAGAGGLTFSDTYLADGKAIRVGSFAGPGVSGSNLWLLPDPAAVPQGYIWPAGLGPGHSLDSSTSSGSSSSTGQSKTAAAVGAAVGAAVFMLLVAAAAGLLLRQRKQRRTQERLLLKQQQQQQHTHAGSGGKPSSGRKQRVAVPDRGAAAGAAAGGSSKLEPGLDTISSCDALLASDGYVIHSTRVKRSAGSLPPSTSYTASRSISTSLGSMDAAPVRDTVRGGSSTSQLELSIAQVGMEGGGEGSLCVHVHVCACCVCCAPQPAWWRPARVRCVTSCSASTPNTPLCLCREWRTFKTPFLRPPCN
jgi:type II secretory pathway pseudopilin PulG